MIGIDWGTTTLRAFRIDPGGAVIGSLSAPRGIMTVEPGAFPAVLRETIAPWLQAGELQILMSGMVGSRQGWVEAPYLTCPAGPAEIAAALVRVPFEGADIRLVPGLTTTDATGTPEVMRGEETQLIGAMSAMGPDALVCLPGSHSKWVRIAAGRVSGFTTYLSGEMFAALRSATILGRTMEDGPTDPTAFDRGLARAAEPGHLLHHLFGVRTLGLVNRLSPAEAGGYLSGLLIGHEVRAALPPGAQVFLIGAAPLCALYTRAIEAAGGRPTTLDEDAAAAGLITIARSAAWT